MLTVVFDGSVFHRNRRKTVIVLEGRLGRVIKLSKLDLLDCILLRRNVFDDAFGGRHYVENDDSNDGQHCSSRTDDSDVAAGHFAARSPVDP